MKKILLISGSNRNGNTNYLLSQIEKETDNSEIIVNDGQTTISYFSSSKKLTNSDEKWPLSSDKTKKVDGISLGER